MAGGKKKKKEKDSGSNVVLLVFVVFLFLVTIGLGIWVYYAIDEAHQARVKQRGSEKALAAEKVVGQYYGMLYRELRLAVGDPLPEKEMADLAVDRQDFWDKDNYGKFKNEESKEAAKKLLFDLQGPLGVAENKKDFKTNFKKELEEANGRIKDLETKLVTLASATKYRETDAAKWTEIQTKSFESVKADIKAKSEAELNALSKQSEAYLVLEKGRLALQEEVEKKEEKIAEIKAEFEAEKRSLLVRIAKLDAEMKEATGGAGGAATAKADTTSFQPLLLTIVTGKPLWDQPVGKIIRVDAELNQVAINIGSAQGARPELTFNVFGANSAGRAEKQLKGSLEIIRVVDDNTSLARITSLFDADGREIILSDLSRSRIVRESEAPIRAGDLLFNLFWGSRVAVAGYVNITGEVSDNPATQISQMDDFRHLLQRNGMQVDAYIDLRDGKIRGNLSSRTRYIILGDRATGAPLLANAKGDEKDPKMNDADAGNDRTKAIDASMGALLKEGMQRGMMMISAENFATVIGYRRARAANDARRSEFLPALPDAGTGIGGGGVLVIPQRPEKKKDMDP
jgi:hypothetical protein